MTVYYQHIGEQWSARDFPRSLGTPTEGLNQDFRASGLVQVHGGYEAAKTAPHIARSLALNSANGTPIHAGGHGKVESLQSVTDSTDIELIGITGRIES